MPYAPTPICNNNANVDLDITLNAKVIIFCGNRFVGLELGFR
jgi:hypothetical protein